MEYFLILKKLAGKVILVTKRAGGSILHNDSLICNNEPKIT